MMHGQQNVKRFTFYLFRSRNHFSVEISAGFLLIISKGLFVRDSTDLGVCVFSTEQETAAVRTGCACCCVPLAGSLLGVRVVAYHWQAAYWVCVLLRAIGRHPTGCACCCVQLAGSLRGVRVDS
jgi:hypothetical protein